MQTLGIQTRISLFSWDLSFSVTGKRKRDVGETFAEEVIFELTGEILLTLSQTEREQAVVGCSGRIIEVLVFPVKEF